MEKKTIWDRIAEEAEDISPKNVDAAIADFRKRAEEADRRIKARCVRTRQSPLDPNFDPNWEPAFV